MIIIQFTVTSDSLLGGKYRAVVFTAISRKVVGKKVHATTPKGHIGYDQYTVPDSVAVEPTFAASL